MARLRSVPEAAPQPSTVQQALLYLSGRDALGPGRHSSRGRDRSQASILVNTVSTDAAVPGGPHVEEATVTAQGRVDRDAPERAQFEPVLQRSIIGRRAASV